MEVGTDVASPRLPTLAYIVYGQRSKNYTFERKTQRERKAICDTDNRLTL